MYTESLCLMGVSAKVTLLIMLLLTFILISFRGQSNCVSTTQMCLTIKFVCFINGLIFFLLDKHRLFFKITQVRASQKSLTCNILISMHLHASKMTIYLSFTPPFPVPSFPFTELLSHLYFEE